MTHQKNGKEIRTKYRLHGTPFFVTIGLKGRGFEIHKESLVKQSKHKKPLQEPYIATKFLSHNTTVPSMLKELIGLILHEEYALEAEEQTKDIADLIADYEAARAKAKKLLSEFEKEYAKDVEKAF